MYRAFLFVLMSSILVACGGGQSITHKLVRKLDDEILKNHNLPHGNLIAVYDLAKLDPKQSKKIYANDYVLTVNDERQNNLFLSKFDKRYKNSKNLWREANVKAVRIKDLMLKLDTKYRFLNSAEKGFFLNKSIKLNSSLSELAQVDKIISGIPIMLPAYNPKVSSHYGMRKHPIKKQNKFHCGIDLVARKSSYIYAAANGVVAKVKKENGYGNTIIIRHSHKFKTRYAHLKATNVKEGERVLKGQKIGVQGKSGNVTGEHLHFEVWYNEKHVDPFDFIVHSEVGKR